MHQGDLGKRIALWACGEDTGLSSMYLATCALGEPQEYPCWPYDPADFGRCLRFAERLTQEERMFALAIAGGKCDRWKKISANWDMMVEISRSKNWNKLYKVMKDLGL